MTINIVIDESVASSVTSAIAAKGGGSVESGIRTMIANAASELAKSIQSGIVRPQMSGATPERRRELVQTIEQAASAAAASVLANQMVVVEVT